MAKFTDPDYVASLKVVEDLKPYFPKGQMGMAETDVQTLFATGKAAMIPEGSFALAPIKAINADLKMGAFNAPPAPGATVDHPLQVGWVDASYGMNAKSKHPKEAQELLQWMTTKEFGQMVADDLKQISLNKSVQPTDELLKTMVDGYRTNPTPYLMLVDFRYGTPLGSDLEAAGCRRCCSGSRLPSRLQVTSRRASLSGSTRRNGNADSGARRTHPPLAAADVRRRPGPSDEVGHGRVLLRARLRPLPCSSSTRCWSALTDSFWRWEEHRAGAASPGSATTASCSRRSRSTTSSGRRSGTPPSSSSGR